MPASGSAIQPTPGSVRLPAGVFVRATTLGLAIAALGAAAWALAAPAARDLLWPAIALMAWATARHAGHLRWILVTGCACAVVFVLRVVQAASAADPGIDSGGAVVALFVALATVGNLRGSTGPPLVALAGFTYAVILLVVAGQPSAGDARTVSTLLALAAAATIAATTDWRALPAPGLIALWLGVGVTVASAAGLAAGLPPLAGYVPGQAVVTLEGQLVLSLLLAAALAVEAGRRALALALLVPTVVLTLLVLLTRAQLAPRDVMPAQFAFDWWLGQRLQAVPALALLAGAIGTLLAVMQVEVRGLLAGRWFVGVVLFLATTLLLVGTLIGLPQALDQELSPPASIAGALGVMAHAAWLLLGGPGTRRTRSLWLPLLAGLAVVASTAQVARLVHDARLAQERRDAAIAVASAESAVVQALQSRTGALDRFAQRLLAVPAAQRARLFKVEAAQALAGGFGMESVARLDGERTIVQVESVRDVSAFVDRKATFDQRRAAAYNDAERSGSPAALGPIVIAGTDVDAILLIQPVPFDDAGRGFLIATYGFAKVFELALAAVAPGHAIVLERDGRTVSRRGLARAGHAWDSAPQRHFELLDARWTVRALPLAIDGTDGVDTTRVERLVGLSGMLLAGLVALALRLAALARERAEAAETAHARLSVVVAERDRAGAALARSERQAQRLLEGMSEGVVRLGDGLLIEYANPRARKLLQQLVPEPLGRRLPELFPRFAGSAFEHCIRDALALNQPVVVDAPVEALGRWLAGRIYPQDGGLIAILSDVTELRSAEQFEKGQQAVLHAIATGEAIADCVSRAIRFFEGRFKGTLVGVLLVDSESLRVRHAIAPGMPAEACLAWSGVELTPTLCSCGPALHRGERVVVEDIDRSPLWEGHRDAVRALGLRACWSQPLRAADGSPIGTFAIYHPEARGPTPAEIDGIETISALVGIAVERDLAGLRVETERQRFRSLSERSPYMVYAFDRERRLVDCNHNVVQEGGFPRESLLGMSAEALVLEPFRETVGRAFDAALLGDSSCFDCAVMTAARQRREVEVTLVPIEVDSRIVGVFGIVRDTTDERRTAAELDRALGDLTARNQELQDFAFVASHDLQEPLRKVQAFSDRVIARFGSQLDAQGVDWLRRIDSAAHRMQVLIDDLLAYSRVTSQGEPFAPVDLAQVVRDVVSDLELRIDQTGASVVVGEIATIDGDRTQLRQLLQNLLANALKFRAPDRAPRITVAASPAPDEEATVLLVVEDNGIGFDPVYAERIFAPFQRLHGREEYEGTGIGLAIVRRIVERHRGRITAEGRPGVGTRFLVWLPRRAADV
jgi:PAS domain S-box-containing protein